MPPIDKDEYKIHLLKTLKQAYEKLINHKEIYQQKYKVYFNKSHKNIEFKEGDFVWVYFGSPENGKTQKLLPRFEGPFEIVNRLDNVTYRLKKENKIIIAHVQRLLKYHTLVG